MKGNQSLLNDVKNRFLSLPLSAVEGLEHEPQISDFEYIKELGIGTFGKVDLVCHKKTKAKYALKYIDKMDPDNLEEKDNFNREVEIMYKLNHPNIVKLYGHFEDEKYCYFIMQYIPNRSVYELIPTGGKKQNVQLIASVMKDLISAVYYLHNMKPTIIHRDIKPENILLDQKSKAYLTDFGWSNYAPNFVRRHTVCGSPLYLPPEMVKGASHDKTADIWCIGVLLFELITGTPPFAGRDMESVAVNILKLNISWPHVEMDPDAKDLITKILQLNGKDRPSLEQILTHKFFSKFFPNAVKELIKPETQKNKTFVVSVDVPNSLERPPKSSLKPTFTVGKKSVKIANDIPTGDNKNNNVYKKANTINNKSILVKNKTIRVPLVNIDLSNPRKRTITKASNNNNNNKIPLNTSYNQKYNRANTNDYQFSNVINKNDSGSNNRFNSNEHRNRRSTHNDISLKLKPLNNKASSQIKREISPGFNAYNRKKTFGATQKNNHSNYNSNNNSYFSNRINNISQSSKLITDQIKQNMNSSQINNSKNIKNNHSVFSSSFTNNN